MKTRSNWLFYSLLAGGALAGALLYRRGRTRRVSLGSPPNERHYLIRTDSAGIRYYSPENSPRTRVIFGPGYVNYEQESPGALEQLRFEMATNPSVFGLTMNDLILIMPAGMYLQPS